jgi:DNA-directed RNA polymerase specialized sigma24 family protein
MTPVGSPRARRSSDQRARNIPGDPRFRGWSDPRKPDRIALEFSATISRLGGERTHMTASKCSDAQKAFIIKHGEEGTSVAEICRKAGISQATYFNWKKRYAGLPPTGMKRLKQIEDGNGRHISSSS